MSEYPGIQNRYRKIDDLDNTGTLFDPAMQPDVDSTQDAELDRMVDTLNISYTEARERLGLDTPAPVSFRTAEVASDLVVSLDDRALALEAIMRYLNKANKTKGSEIHIETGGERMRQQYGVPGVYDVQEGAEVNRDKLRDGFMMGIRTLAAVEQMRAQGYDEDAIEHERMRLQMQINQEFGVRNAYAPKRHKAARDARRVADYTSGRKKPRRRSR